MSNLNTEKMSKGKAVAILMTGVAALAFSAIMVKKANFEPSISAFLRCCIGFLTLIPFAWYEIKKRGALSKQGFLLSALAGLFLGTDMTAWNYAIFYVGAGISSIILNVQIIILPGLAVIFDKYKPKPIFWYLLVPAMLIGVILSGGVLETKEGAVEGPEYIYGIRTAVIGTLLGSLSGICYGCYLYSSRKAGTINAGKYVQPLMWVFLFQLVPQTISMLAPWGNGFFSDLALNTGVLDANGLLPIENPETLQGAPITITNWLWMILLGVIGHAMAWVFVQIGAVNMEPATAATLLILSPITTVIVAPFIVPGETISGLQALGVVIVLVAVAIQNELYKPLLKKFGGK